MKFECDNVSDEIIASKQYLFTDEEIIFFYHDDSLLVSIFPRKQSLHIVLL